MSYWKNLRVPFLAVTFSGVLLVLGKSIFHPAVNSYTITPFTFPSAVPLPEWQSLTSSPLVEQTVRHPEYSSGRHYRYIQSNLLLDAKMRYLIDTNGDVENFIKIYTPNKSSSVLRHNQQIGYYSLFTSQGKAYLNTCINPHGGTTVTARQFKQNRNTSDLQLSRLLPWLLSQQDLKDERCLWTYLSIPLKRSSPEHSYEILEQAWFSWYKWWRSRFPEA